MRIVYELRSYVRLLLSHDKVNVCLEFDPESTLFLTPAEVDDLIEALTDLRPHMKETK